MNRSQNILFLFGLIGAIALSACSSAKKERLEQREKLANSSGLYCDFVNGEKFTDVEVMVNLEMAKRCDSSKPFSISNYKSPAEVIGMMYCCAVKKNDVVASASVAKPATAPAAQAAPSTMIGTPPAKTAPAAAPANRSNDMSDEVIGE